MHKEMKQSTNKDSQEEEVLQQNNAKERCSSIMSWMMYSENALQIMQQRKSLF